MATISISLKNGFADNSTRTLNLQPFSTTATAVQQAKTNIMNINANNVDAIASVYKSDTGSGFTGIQEATIIATNSTLIYARTTYLGELALKAVHGDD